ncbi:MAG: hypothetical protein HZB91_13845 [Elusimicrobia bacterium]|nr:hypothetical protein [Elusimicrobiota bacterium]
MNGTVEELKGSARLTLAQALCGLVIGVLVAAEHAAISYPDLHSFVMTHRMFADLGRVELLRRFLHLLDPHGWVWLIAMPFT